MCLSFNSAELVSYSISKQGKLRAYERERAEVESDECLKLDYLGKQQKELTSKAPSIFHVTYFEFIRHKLPLTAISLREAYNHSGLLLKEIHWHIGFQLIVLIGRKKGHSPHIGIMDSTCTALYSSIDSESWNLQLTCGTLATYTIDMIMPQALTENRIVGK